MFNYLKINKAYGKHILGKKCVTFFCSKHIFAPANTWWGTLHCMEQFMLLLLSDFNQNWNVPTDFSKIRHISNLSKVKLLVLKLLCVDRWGEAKRCTYETVCTEHTENMGGWRHR